MNLLQTTSRCGALLAAALAVASCAVSPGKVAEQAGKAVDTMATAKEQTARRETVVPLTRMKGNYLGGSTLAVSNSLSLPPQARDVYLNFGPGATGSLDDVAANVRSATGIPVRINADVVNRGARVVAGSAAAAPRTGAPLPSPLPSGAAAGTAPRQVGLLALTFQGDLGDYLTMVASTLGISWEYVNGEIHFFRRVTRTFTLMVSPGALTVRDEVSSSGGSSGGGTQGGNFNGTTSASTAASYNPWESAERVIKAMVSSEGTFAINQASGTIVVTDSREAVERIGEWVRQENAALTRQVAIEVREIAVQLNRESQVGLDLDLIYQRINRATGATDWAFRFGSPASLTDAAAGSMAFNIAKPESKLAGSNVAVRALNELGNIVLDSSRTVVTTNRVPGRLQDVTDRAYLAETTPASGGGTSGGVGVPGLKPGVITYGDNLILVPTIGENNSVLLQLFSQRSSLLELSSVSTGSGETMQQINTPVLARKKNSQNFQMRPGETLVIVGNNAENWTSRDVHSVTGGSRTASQLRTISVLLVTPRVMQGG